MGRRKQAVEITPARLESIQSDANSGENWAELVSYGPACHCGLRSRKEPCTRHMPIEPGWVEEAREMLPTRHHKAIVGLHPRYYCPKCGTVQCPTPKFNPIDDVVSWRIRSHYRKTDKWEENICPGGPIDLDKDKAP